MNFSSVQSCPHSQFCSGCQFLGQSLQQQKDFKIKKLSSALTQIGLCPTAIEFISPGDFALRDRMDFVFENNQWGMYSSSLKKIVDLNSCGQLSDELHSFYLEFRKIKWPIRKGSFRLRTGLQGLRGAWLDFSNHDVKNLLEQETHLRGLMSLGSVEIGQKAKTLVDRGGKLKLAEPSLQAWFETRFQEKNFPLLGSIASFTQPSRKANLFLGKLLEQHYAGKKFKKTIEFGAGIGNLSLIFLDASEKFMTLEFDTQASVALKENLKHAGQCEKVEIQVDDFQRRQSFNWQDCDFLILNPPRSGVGNFLETLTRADSNRPREVFLMSCFLDSWQRDAGTLNKNGYFLERVAIFDQFPQTQHFEILSFWR